MPNTYYVYIATNGSHTVLYTGITNDRERRMREHNQKKVPGFTANYNVVKLVHYETFPNPEEAIAAEKKIKGWTRAKKIALIKNENPRLADLLSRDSSLRPAKRGCAQNDKRG